MYVCILLLVIMNCWYLFTWTVTLYILWMNFGKDICNIWQARSILVLCSDTEAITITYSKTVPQTHWQQTLPTFYLCTSMETEKSVPFGLLIRCKRICGEEKYFNEESEIIIQQLTSRKYPMKLLQEALDKVKKMDRLQLLRHSTKKESN